MMYVIQVIFMYTLNLHSAMCHLYLNKSKRNKSFKKLDLIGMQWNELEL